MTDRFAAVHAQLATAARNAGRKPECIRLLAVSKAQPAAALRALYAQGQRDFGENYAQEMVAKAAALADLTDLRLVYIGALQSNKIPLIVRTAVEIQSVGSLRHAHLIAREVASLGVAPYPVYLLVNAGDEVSKSGVALGDVTALAEAIARELPELTVMGLMAIPPPLAEGVTTPPPLYIALRTLASKIGRGRLSLGMSQDLAIAIAAGSDCVRIGTALFGARTAH